MDDKHMYTSNPDYVTTTQLPSSDDLISESLRHIRPIDTLYSRADLTAPWGVEIPALEGGMMLYVVTHGHCWLQVDGDQPRLLQRGSIALMPHGTHHILLSNQDVPATHLFDIPVEKVTPRYEIMKIGGGGELTQVAYGGVRFDRVAGLSIVELLPLVVQIDTWDQEDSWVQSTVRLISREAREQRPGAETVITRLMEILVIQTIRTWIDTVPESEQGWLSAMRDELLAPSLAAIHREPQKPWSIQSLARVAGMSRSAFAARFSETVGEPVMEYVTRWRMQLAHSLLMESTEPLRTVAERTGYASEATFSRAFKREFGVAPGAIRRSSTST